VRAESLQTVLDAALSAEDQIEQSAPAHFSGMTQHAGHTDLAFTDRDTVSARLVVGADGLHSTVRETLGIETLGRDYRKSVFTADVELAHPHDGIARQLFLPEGPFAILPLQGQRANLAWYLKRGAAESLAREPAEAIEAELNSRLAHFAGPMKLSGNAGAYPLILQLAQSIVGQRAVLVGDAARRINPLAGQGLNQGFRDVRALIDILTDALRVGEDIGSDLVLSRYSAERRFDGTAAGLALDAIDRLFSNDSALTKPARSVGLFAAQHITPLRRVMARYASATDAPEPRRGLEP
ncbi:MAG: FAD-dependent monooxygenase, partial [Pseudomonadota bacterium]